jgi:hypothetical protein
MIKLFLGFYVQYATHKDLTYIYNQLRSNTACCSWVSLKIILIVVKNLFFIYSICENSIKEF